jgi:3-oxoacid CoA-transferase subunit A
MSGRHTFAEVEHLVEVDAIHPDDVHLPGVFVDDVLLAAPAAAGQPQLERTSS